MSKKSPTKAERAHMDRVVALGCIVCDRLGHPDSPALIHHIRTGQGTGQRASHYETLPLCPRHHHFYGAGVSFHDDPKLWQELYGTELELLEEVYRSLGRMDIFVTLKVVAA